MVKKRPNATARREPGWLRCDLPIRVRSAEEALALVVGCWRFVPSVRDDDVGLVVKPWRMIRTYRGRTASTREDRDAEQRGARGAL